MGKKTRILLWTLFLSFLFFIFRRNCIQGFRGFTDNKKQTLFNDFMKEHYSNIFPKRGRNAGGPMFYHYFVNNMDLDRYHFKLYNQFYCGVSGSIISPNLTDKTNTIVLKDLNDKEWFGKYYRCCTPCSCDIMRYARVEKHTVNLSDGVYPHFVITIDDPCINEELIPREVTSYQCQNKQTQNGERTESGRLIIGVLFGQNEMEDDPVRYNQNIHTIDAHKHCKSRICQSPKDLSGGMGDIFVLLSQVGNDEELPKSPEHFDCSVTEPLTNQLLNIYGTPLEPCRDIDNIEDISGSWDENGYCSELDGGVHQICFNVNQNTEKFSSQTGQSDWSLSRSGNNHCMCLGAWALYKAKQSRNKIPTTKNELKCDAIPEISLTENYVNKWKKWNDNELKNQIVDGVNNLVKQCYTKENDIYKKRYLKQKYIDLIQNKSEFEGKYLSFNE